MGEQLECLWVRIIDGLCHLDDIVVGVCCRPPDQDEQVDEVFFEELEVASHSQAMVLAEGPQATWCLLQGQHSRV